MASQVQINAKGAFGMSNRFKYFFTGLALCVALTTILLAAFLGYELFIEPLPSKTDKAFIASIRSRLKEPGDWAKVSEIHPGNWTEVCLLESMSTGGTQDPQTLRRRFNIEETVNLTNGIVSASDWNWAVMFFYPPNTVEAFKIPNKNLFEYGVYPKEGNGSCRPRDEAAFLMRSDRADKSVSGVQLRSVEQIGDH